MEVSSTTKAGDQRRMIEVPTAAILADLWSRAEVDFFSIGTNDLEPVRGRDRPDERAREAYALHEPTHPSSR